VQTFKYLGILLETTSNLDNAMEHLVWHTPNSLKDSNVSPSERQRKEEESRRAP
jgi:hypothetical protein